MPRRPKNSIDPANGRRADAAEAVNQLATELDAPLKEAYRQIGLLSSDCADRDMATAAASLLRAVTSAVAEKRQLQRHALKLTDELSPEETHRLVASYLRTCDRHGRDEFRRILAEMDAQERGR